jgi:hypothetical protein
LDYFTSIPAPGFRVDTLYSSHSYSIIIIMLRGGIYGLLAIAALAFALAAIGTNIASWFENVNNSGGYNFHASPWQLCGRVADYTASTSCHPVEDFNCGPLEDRYRAMQAFYVLTCVAILAALIFAVLDHGNVHEFKYYKPLLLIFALSIIIFSLIGWAIAISIPRQSFCGSGRMSDRAGFEWEASPFLLIITTIIGIVMLIVAHRAPHGSTEHVRPHHVSEGA